MGELFHESFRLVNFPFTVLLLLVAGYWLLVAIGALGGPQGADAGMVAHAEAHTDLDHDAGNRAHGHVAGHHQGHLKMRSFAAMLKFLNPGEIPVMVAVSILALWMWTFSVTANCYWTGDSTLLKGAALAANLVVSGVATRYLTMLLKPLFRAIRGQYDVPIRLLGRRCRVTTPEATVGFGQAEVATEGAPIVINVRTMHDEVMHKGDLAVIVRVDEERRIFYITANPLPEPIIR